MVTKRTCRVMIEAICRANPHCPLLRQCDLFSSTCHIPNFIDMDREGREQPPPDPPPCTCKAKRKRSKSGK